MATCRVRTNVRLCGRHWRMILSIVTRAHGTEFDAAPLLPSRCAAARTLTKSSLGDDRRHDAWPDGLTITSIVEACIVSELHLPLPIATRVASYSARWWTERVPFAFRVYPGLFAHAPAFIWQPSPFRRHNSRIPEAAGCSPKAVLHEFSENASKGLPRACREKKRKVDRCRHRLSAKAEVTYIPGDSWHSSNLVFWSERTLIYNNNLYNKFNTMREDNIIFRWSMIIDILTYENEK